VITPAPRPAPAVKPAAAPRPPRQQQDETEEESDVLTEEELTEEGETALEVIGTLLSHLSIQAETDLIVSEPDDLTGRRINTINITGNDLGVLIGQRGETLDAIQYISRLMISHRLQRKATFTIDIESYRQRRKDALARLAERMAQKVTKQRRPVTLEPMPPHERRAVHMALRNFRGVYTQSTGTGDRRRVRIFPER
jgi:spoIIIJ-associated protein